MDDEHELVNSDTAERTILGLMLRDATSFFQVSDLLMPDHFVREVNAQIYTQLQNLHTEGRSPTIALLIARIGDEYEGGKSTLNYLSALYRDGGKDREGTSAMDFVEPIIGAWRKRRLVVLSRWINQQIAMPDVDTNDLLENAIIRINDIRQMGEADPIVSIGELAERAFVKSEAARMSGEPVSISTGMPTLDNVIGRIRPEEFGAIIASQGHSKTSIAAQIANGVEDTAFFQLEMSENQTALRALAHETNIEVNTISDGEYDLFEKEDLEQAIAKLKQRRIYFEARGARPLSYIRNRAMQIKRTNGLKLVVVDHMDKVLIPGVKDKWARMAAVTDGMKSLSRELGVCVILLCQRIRSAQRRTDTSKPHINDADAPSLERDADWVIGAARHDFWLKDNPPTIAQDGSDKSNAIWDAYSRKLRDSEGKIQFYNLKMRSGTPRKYGEMLFDGRRYKLLEYD